MHRTSPRNHRWSLTTIGVVGTLIALTAALAACDTTMDAPDDQYSDPGGATVEPPPPGIAYRVAYDETSITTSQFWPSGTVGGGFRRGEQGEELIENYSATHQEFQFDEEGHFRRKVEYMEGNADTWLPEDFHAAVVDEMPAPNAGHDPIISYEIDSGRFRALSVSGAVVAEEDFGPDAYRIPLEVVEILMNASQDTTSAQGRAAEVRANLESSGVSFRELGGGQVGVEGEPDEEGFRERAVLDVHTGLPQLVASIRPDGRNEYVQFSAYEYFGRAPVATQIVTYHYGEVNGSWEVTHRNEIIRTNVTVNLQ